MLLNYKLLIINSMNPQNPEPLDYQLSESDANSIAEDLDAIIDAYPELHPMQVLGCLQSVVISRIREFRDKTP